MDEYQIADINILASFLAHEQIQDLASCKEIDAVVICPSEALCQSEALFSVLQQNHSLAKTLVLCGGTGHSTTRIYEAVARNPNLHTLRDEISNLAEARILEKIMATHYNINPSNSSHPQVLIEDKSTNCGLNAIYSKQVLDEAHMTSPHRIIVVQDPTMMRRTIASFEKAYESTKHPPEILACPFFVPKLKLQDSHAVFTVEDIPASQLWDLERFLDLVMGEIPRIRDDENGYGPRGKGFITHVEIPGDVEAAWRRLKETLSVRR